MHLYSTLSRLDSLIGSLSTTYSYIGPSITQQRSLMSLSPAEVQFFSEVVKITLSPTVVRGKMENLVLPRKLRHS